MEYIYTYSEAFSATILIIARIKALLDRAPWKSFKVDCRLERDLAGGAIAITAIIVNATSEVSLHRTAVASRARSSRGFANISSRILPRSVQFKLSNHPSTADCYPFIIAAGQFRRAIARTRFNRISICRKYVSLRRIAVLPRNIAFEILLFNEPLIILDLHTDE